MSHRRRIGQLQFISELLVAALVLRCGTPPTAIAGTPGDGEDYTLDQLGNWPGYVKKAAVTTTLNQSRAHNKATEIDTNEIDDDGRGASIANSG